MAHELEKAGLNFFREIEQDIFYKDLAHSAQTLNYLKAYKLEVGLLINFESKSLTFKRLMLSETKSAKSHNP